MKICTRCKKRKYLKSFPPDKRKKDGLQSWCRECFKEKQAERVRTEDHKKWLSEYLKREDVKSRLRLKQSKHRKSEKGRAWWRKYRQTAKHKQYRLSFEKDYRQRANAKLTDQIGGSRYRGRKRSTDDGTATAEATKNLLRKQRNRCKVCRCCLVKNKKHLDHIKPLSKGGRHSIKNLQWLCAKCNRAKSNKVK